MSDAKTGTAGSAPWHGFAVVREQPLVIDAAVREVTATLTGWQMELAGDGACDWEGFAQRLFAGIGQSEALEMSRCADPEARTYRVMAFVGNTLAGALLVAPHPLDIRRDWLVARLGTPLDAEERFRLLDGRPGGTMQPRGPIVCFCCYVGRNEIGDAIAQGAGSIGAVGLATRAGTNCGRCRPEIGQMLGQSSAAPPG